MFLTQIIGCICAALVVALLWEHSRIRELERRADDLEEVADLHAESIIQILKRP